MIKTGAQNLVKIADGASEKLVFGRLPHIAHRVLDVGEKLEVTIGAITWTSDLASDDTSGSGGQDNRGTYGDARDTWIGENVGSVGFAYSWSAVQGSEIPTNP